MSFLYFYSCKGSILALSLQMFRKLQISCGNATFVNDDISRVLNFQNLLFCDISTWQNFESFGLFGISASAISHQMFALVSSCAVSLFPVFVLGKARSPLLKHSC